jgi:uncharacterized coiled-coil protein SlyX
MAAYGNAAYANIALVPERAIKRSAVAQRAAAAQVNAAEARLKTAVDRANRLLDKLEERAAAQAAAIKELSKRKAATLARVARIEGEILKRMDEAALTVVTGTRCSMRSQPAAASLVVLDESLIPAEYMRTPKPGAPTPDKTSIKKALEANDDLDPAAWGCRLSTTISLIRK